ncbi:2Fe-2S iron-sulfur cluster-binding protein [Ideonella sp.]|uniref:2Fe-2S iron-sulfur cluster-binding protein n=1 Tax=Ideonella sp. TaxID=1929293 RepID=UPI003BB53FFE
MRTDPPTSALGVAPSSTLRIEPAGWCMPVAPGASLLEAAQAAGVRLARSCRNGTCRACLCRLISGTIAYRVDWPGLSAEEKQAGWILPCVAVVPAPGDVTIDAPAATPLPQSQPAPTG